VLAGKAIDTLEFDDQSILDNEVSDVLTNALTLIGDRKNSLRLGGQASQP